MLEGDRRGSGGPVAHRDTPEVVGVKDCCRNWSRLRRFWRGAAEGNCELPATGTSPTRFLQRGHLTRRDRAPELLREAQSDLHQRRPTTTGARVSVLEEKLKGQGRRWTGEPGAYPRRQGYLITAGKRQRGPWRKGCWEDDTEQLPVNERKVEDNAPSFYYRSSMVAWAGSGRGLGWLLDRCWAAAWYVLFPIFFSSDSFLFIYLFSVWILTRICYFVLRVWTSYLFAEFLSLEILLKYGYDTSNPTHRIR
jgi:hypothetical protein